MNEIRISALHYQWENLEQAFHRCENELGLDGVEWSFHFGADFKHISEKHYDDVLRLSKTSSLKQSAHVWADLAADGVEEATRKLRDWLGAAQKLALDYLIIHGGTHDDRDLGIEITAQTLSNVADAYEAAGVTICLENHYAYDYNHCHELFSTPGEFLRVFEAVDSPAVRFCLDYGHSNMTGNTAELLEHLGPYLAYTHIADNMGEHDDHLAYREGTVDWEREMCHTLSVGFRGPFVIEYPERRCGAARFEEFVELVKRLDCG